MRADERLEDDERDWLEGRRQEDRDLEDACGRCGEDRRSGCGCAFDRVDTMPTPRVRA